MNNPWIDISPPSDDVSARRIDHTHPLDLFWARDHIGHYLFICEATDDRPLTKNDIPNLTGIHADFISLNGKTRLVLLLNEQANWEIFYALCNDLVQATRPAKDSSVAFTIILRRLARWHEFLKHARPDILSEEQIKGLIGELLFLKNHLMPKFGGGPAVNFWIGPEGAPQDFNIHNAAVEVKCQSGASRPYVKITSAEQLCPQLPNMFLYVATLGRTTSDHPSATNLPTLVGDIGNTIQSTAPQQLERFNDLLYGLGYIDSEKYENFSYTLTDEIMFKVTDGFPRICDKDLHEGILNLTYNISISECIPFTQWPEWLEQ